MRISDAPLNGDNRVVRRFILYPCQYGRDWRWLEWANVKQIYDSHCGWVTHGWAE